MTKENMHVVASVSSQDAETRRGRAVRAETIDAEAGDSAAIIERLRDQLRATVFPLAEGYRTAALIDFPDHSNVGDSAIWVGALRLLADAAIEVGYRCNPETYNRRHLRRSVPAGPIFINGGGNLGDVWRRHQRLRLKVLQDFPDRPIIQLPQTVHFQQPENLAAARQQFDAHVNFTLLVRDQSSLELVRRAFRAHSALCPDLAFYLGRIEREWQPDVDILWLRRDDRESAGSEVPVSSDVVVCDWLDERVPTLRRVRSVLRPLAAREPRSLGLMNRALAAAYDQQARQQLRQGCRLLSRGRVVITDRLHAHILCLLLGIPHVLLDNSYGKVRRVHEAWTADVSQVRWAASPAEAVTAARSLLTA
jgi:exopolysaccharide biosynthesis predicted pyruvyltransferase EpsI